jgi:diadenylate cyclase
MANRRIGGLIVFQKGDNLDELIHEKTDLDAEIHEDLLISIFSPQSPLHDGAVVVQGDRIRHAAALLPLCKSTSLPKEWGTRHRAGVGITEISDAECMIISEERGEVLLACKGTLQKKERREDLKQALVDVAPVQQKKNAEKSWPKKLIEDLPRKGLFFLLVCLLWVFVIGLRQGEVVFDIPIEYYSVPQNLAITGEPPKELNVRLKGSQRLLLSLKPDQIRVRVDLSKTHKGTNQISLSEANIDAGPGISVSNYYPRNIRLQLSPAFPADRVQ